MEKDKYIIKSDLTKRWSMNLIKKYFPVCSVEKPNPFCIKHIPMQYYDLDKVAEIEATDAFRADYEKIKKCKLSALDRAKDERDNMVNYANTVKIDIPTFNKDELIKKACSFHNRWKSLWGYKSIATPFSNEEFIKSITMNYLLNECTEYHNELSKLFGKVGVSDAQHVLKERINDAIREKYEWLR